MDNSLQTGVIYCMDGARSLIVTLSDYFSTGSDCLMGVHDTERLTLVEITQL